MSCSLTLPSLPLFFPSGSIQGNGFEKACFIVIEDIGLGSTDIGVNSGRLVWTVTQKKFPDKPATAEGAQEATSSWS